MRNKIAAVVLALLATLSVVSTAAPAEAKDSSWGCGGACRTHR